MGYFKRGCAVFLASTMILGLLPGMSARAAEEPGTAAKEAAAASDFDAYRTPFLSGPVQTWVYQGEEFDYENSRNQIFADDQEDGDLTKSIIQKGSVDTAELGDQTVTYEVTDSDGHTSALETTVTVLAKGSGDEDKKKIQRKLYTLPDASHLSNIGFNRGYYHDRQNLGFWLPAGETLTVRLVNHEEFSGELKLKLVTDDSKTEKLVELDESGQMKTNQDGSLKVEGTVNIPASGEPISVKNYCKAQDAAGNELENSWQSVDSVPFIFTPKNTPVQPLIEITWNDALKSVPYYRYGDDQESFFAGWDETKDPYAIIEGDAATFLVPIIDRNNIIDRPGTRAEYQFHTIDEMLEWYAAFVKQYDAYAGLDFYTDQPFCQNVRAKFFIKANKHGAGAAYYGGEESATNGASMNAYLAKEWTSLHEFGHGYEGAIAHQENSFVETTNNILGYYFEQTYRPDDDLGWLLGGKGSTYLEAYNNIGRWSESVRKKAVVFSDMTEGAKQYDKTLFMFINMFDRLGPATSVPAMHTMFRQFNYEHGYNMSSSDAIVDSLSRAGGYNIVPYFEGWHLTPSKVLVDQIYDQDLPMLYNLRTLIRDDVRADDALGDGETEEASARAAADAQAEQIRAQLAAKGLPMNGIYSLVSTDDLAEFNLTSHVSLKLAIDDVEQIQGKKIRIKNGRKVAEEVTVEAGKTEYKMDLPVGIYEVEAPMPKDAKYQFDNEYLAAVQGNVEKEISYQNISGGNPLLDDAQVRLMSMGGEAVTFTLHTAEGKLNYRINDVEPHIYFPKPQYPWYIKFRILKPDGTEIFSEDLAGNEKPGSPKLDQGQEYKMVNALCDFPVGSKIEISYVTLSELKGKLFMTSRYTRKDLSAYAVTDAETNDAGQATITLVMTEKGLMQEGWDKDTRDQAYYSMMTSYSDYLLERMTTDDLDAEGSFHNAKLALAKAYEKLSETEKEEYDKKYGRLLGHEQTLYGYEKIDPSLLTGTADSSQSGEEPQYALDESDSNNWHTSYGIDCITSNKNTYTIALSTPKDVARLDYIPKSVGGNGHILSYRLEYSTETTGEAFTDITPAMNKWDRNTVRSTATFLAPGARRIRITGLDAVTDSTKKFLSARHFYLYERHEIKTTATYLTDLELGIGDSVTADETHKTVSMPAGTAFTADLIGKEFDTLAARVSVAGNAEGTVFKLYNGEGADAEILYQFDATSADTEQSFMADIAGIRKLKFEASAGAQITLSNARFGNREHKKDIFLVGGDVASASANMSLKLPSEGKTQWTSDAAAVAAVDECGMITAESMGETVIREQVSGSEEPLICNVYVKNSLADVITAIEAVKAEKKAALAGYTDAGNYNEEGKTERTVAIEKGNAAIDAAMNLSGISAALDAAKKELDAIATSADNLAEALKQKKAEAKQALEDYKNPDDYRKLQRQELKRIIAEGWLAIDQQTNTAGVERALSAAKAKLDLVQTNLAMTKDELEQMVSDVRGRMENLEEGDYDPAAWKRLQDKLSAADEVIANAAATVLEMETARKELAAAENALLKPQAVKDAEKELQDLIEDYEANLAEADYQAESWKSYQAVLKDAKTYLPGGENEQFEDAAPILKAQQDLIDAKEAMEPTMLVLEGDWIKGLKSSDSAMAVEDGKLYLTGAGSGNNPATFVSAETFDFTQDGFIEFDIARSDKAKRTGIYLDYRPGGESGNSALGMYMGIEGDGSWYWQRFKYPAVEEYGSSSVRGGDANQKQHVKVVWTNDGYYSLYVDGEIAIERVQGIGIGDGSASGKIALSCVSDVEVTASNIRPLQRQMMASPSEMKASTAKVPVKLDAKFRSVADRKTKASWSSSNENVAYVDRAGNVYFVGTGDAEITARATLADGTAHSAKASVSLPESITGSKTETNSAEESGLIKGAYANTQVSDSSGSDGPASYVIDGDATKKWHSWYSGGEHFVPSEENPAKLTIEFSYDLSAGTAIKFLQTESENGQVQKYQVVTGDKFNPVTHEITDNALSGIKRMEAEIVENPIEENKWVTLELPQTEDASGRMGRYLQIQVLKGRNNFACIKEISAEFAKDIANDTAEQGYMAANGQYVAAIKALEEKVSAAEGALRKNYKETDWNALQDALADATDALESGTAAKAELEALESVLAEALLNTTIQYAVTFNWNVEGADEVVSYVEQNAQQDVHAVPLTRDDAPKRKRYYFTGRWYLDSGCQRAYSFETALTEDIELFAQWLPSADNQALLTAIAEAKAELNGNYTSESINTLRNQIQKAQKVADDDYATSDELRQAESDLRAAIDALVLNGQPVVEHTVTFDWNDGKGTVVTGKVRHGSCATPPSQNDAPERDGWEFTGKWYAESDCTNEVNVAETLIVGDRTFHAGWERVPDPDPNPGLTQAKKDLEAVLGQTSNLTEANYSQKGWQSLQDAIQSARNALNANDEDTVVKAKKALEDAIAYTETAETAEKKAELQSLYEQYLREYDESAYTKETWELFQRALDAVEKVLQKGDAATLKEITDANDALEEAKEGLRSPSGDVTHTVTFNWNYEGAQNVTRTVKDGGQASALTETDAPKRDGYTFTGKWYRDPACAQEYEFDKETVTGDLELYAGWKSNGGNSSGDGDNKDDESDKVAAAKTEAKKALTKVQDSAKKIVASGKGDYTPESWDNFIRAYNAVKDLTEQQKNSMSASALNKLTEDLKKAQAALKKIEKEAPEKKIANLKFAAKTYQIANGKSVNLMKELTILPEEAVNQKLVWTMSGSSKYAKLNGSTGVVKALKKGIKKSVTITVATEDGKVSDKAIIKVMKGRVSKIAAKGSTKVKVKAGKSVTLKANAKTTGGKPVNKALKWTSSNPQVATVKGSGKLAASAKVKIAKGAKKGNKATITAVSTDGTNKKLKFTVTVK